MSGLRTGSYLSALGALLVAGVLAGSGIALADDDGGSTNGADGHDGTATTHCKTKASTDIYAPLQCYPSTPGSKQSASSSSGDSDDNQSDDDNGQDYSGHGRDGANGTATHNGPQSPTDGGNNPAATPPYQNPVTQEQHTIPIPNIG